MTYFFPVVYLIATLLFSEVMPWLNAWVPINVPRRPLVYRQSKTTVASSSFHDGNRHRFFTSLRYFHHSSSRSSSSSRNKRTTLRATRSNRGNSGGEADHNSKGAEDGVNLSSLNDYDSDAEYLRESIRKWLDVEYIPQEVHALLGEEVSRVYSSSRQQGVVDLGELLMIIGGSLEQFDMGDAFVNAWDVANRASDFLMLRMERELCSCAGDLSEFQSTGHDTDVQQEEQQPQQQQQSITDDDDDVVSPDVTDDANLKPADEVTPISFTMTTSTSSPRNIQKSIKKATYSGRTDSSSSSSSSSGDEWSTKELNDSPLQLPSNLEQLQRLEAAAASLTDVGISFGSVEVSPYQLRNAARIFHSEFSRYKLLEDFFEGDVDWDTMHPVIALALGFRVEQQEQQLQSSTTSKQSSTAIFAREFSSSRSSSGCGGVNSTAASDCSQSQVQTLVQQQQAPPAAATTTAAAVVVQQEHVAMAGWEGLKRVPDFSNCSCEKLKYKMTLDLPLNAGSTDVVVESLVGMELYKSMKSSADPMVQHRILIAKWLYVHGFLGNIFPAEEKYVPFHFLEQSENNTFNSSSSDSDVDDTW